MKLPLRNPHKGLVSLYLCQVIHRFYIASGETLACSQISLYYLANFYGHCHAVCRGNDNGSWLKQIWDQARETRWQPQCSTPSRDIWKVSSLSFSPPIDNFPHSTHHCFNITLTGPAPKFWLIMAHSTSWSVSLKNVLSSTYNLMNRCINIASLVDSFVNGKTLRSALPWN